MKPLSPIHSNTGQPATEQLADTAGSELEQRLFQVLARQAAPSGVTNGYETAASLSTSQHRSDDLPRSLAGELAAAAYALAGYVQQLTAAFAPTQTQAQRDTQRAAAHEPSGHAVNVRLEATTAGGGLASVELLHPEFGVVTLTVELANGALRVTAIAESERAANAIAQGQAVLVERLRQQGVTLEALDVNVARQRSHANKGERSRTRQRRQES